MLHVPSKHARQGNSREARDRFDVFSMASHLSSDATWIYLTSVDISEQRPVSFPGMTVTHVDH